jgi:ketosteroid isomerase-like protein
MEASKETVARQFEKWKNGEALFFDLLDENVVWSVSGRSPVSGTYHGKADFMERAVNPLPENSRHH